MRGAIRNMDTVRTRRLLVGLGAAALVLALATCWLRGRRGLREAPVDSGPVLEALVVLRALADDPDRYSAHLLPGVNELARVSVEQAAGEVHGAVSIEMKHALWLGEYLRVDVAFHMPDGSQVERYFLLTRHGGKLRITGTDK